MRNYADQLMKIGSAFVSLLLIAVLAFAQGGVLGPKGVVGPKGVMGQGAAVGTSITCVQGGAGCTNATGLACEGSPSCTKAFGVNVTNGDTIFVLLTSGPSAVNTAPPAISVPTDNQGGAGNTILVKRK